MSSNDNREMLEATAEIRKVAERLSIESQLATASHEGGQLRGAMGHLAKDLFKALAALARQTPSDTVGEACSPREAVERASKATARLIVGSMRDTAAEVRAESDKAADALLGVAEAIEEKIGGWATNLGDNYARIRADTVGEDAVEAAAKKLAAEIMVAMRQARFPKEYAAEAEDEFEYRVLRPMLSAALASRSTGAVTDRDEGAGA